LSVEAIESLSQGEKLPTPFLTVRVHDLGLSLSLTAICTGYENARWRAAGLAQNLLAWVPDFAFRYSERKALSSGIAQEQIRQAMLTIFGGRSVVGRGEPGEEPD